MSQGDSDSKYAARHWHSPRVVVMPRARVATWTWATSCASGGLRPIGDLGELQRKGDADRVRDVAGAAVDVNDGEEEEEEEE